MDFYGNTIIEWLTAFIIIISSFFLAKLVYWLCKNIIKKFTKKTKNEIDDLLIDNIEEPFAFSIIIFGFWTAIQFLYTSDLWESRFEDTFYILFSINITWLISRIFSAVITNYLQPLVEKTESDLDDQLLPILKKGINITIWSLGILVGLNNAGINVGALLAGLGVGGIAFAMASRDTIANLFGGLTIFTDHPFRINERVRTKEFDGYVREIGLRTTRIESRSGAEVIVPNNKISNETIENISLEKFRRVDKIIFISNDIQSDKLNLSIKLINNVLSRFNSIDSYRVGLHDFNEFSFGIRIVYHISKRDNYIYIKNEVNQDIVKSFISNDIKFPSRIIVQK